jgi:hypothetical protein
MKPKMFSLKFFPLIAAGTLLTVSCSTNKVAVCPDFSKNRSYSKKYQAGYKVNIKHYKHLRVIKPHDFNLQTLYDKKEKSRQFTIDLNRTIDIKYPYFKPNQKLNISNGKR